MDRQPTPIIFGVFRTGNYMKSRYYQDAESALEKMKIDGSEILQQRKGTGTIRLYSTKGEILYKGKLLKKGLTCVYSKNKLLNSVFIMNKDFTKEELALLATPEDEVRKIASNLKAKAIEFKNLKKDAFNSKMSKASSVIVIRKHNDGKVDINGWPLFKKVAKPRDPGKVTYEKLAERILKVYQAGNDMLCEQQKNAELCSNSNATGRLSQETVRNMDAQKFVDSLVRMVMVYTDENEYVKSYLADKNLTLTGEVSELTKGILNCEEDENSIKFVSMTGKVENVSCANGSRDKFKQTLETTVTKLVTNAAISSKTHELISSLVDMTSLEDMAYN